MFRPRKIPRKNRQRRKAPTGTLNQKKGTASNTRQLIKGFPIKLKDPADIQKIIGIREKDLRKEHPDWNIQRVRKLIARELGIPAEHIEIKK